MKKRVTALVCAALMALLAACGPGSREAEVYRAVQPWLLSDGAAVRTERVSVDASLSELDAAVAAFNAEAGDTELLRALPEGVDVLGYTLEDGELRLEVSPEYAAVTGRWRTVGDCCMTLTFCAVEGVESVSVHAGGTQLSAAMAPEDFVLTDVSGIQEE